MQRSWSSHRCAQTATAAGRATTKRAPVRAGGLAPQPRPHRFAEPLGGVQADARAARGVRVASGVRLEDPLAPFLGDARALVGDARAGRPPRRAPSRSDRRVGRRVLDRVLDEVLDDLAKARRVGQRVEPDGRRRSRPGGARAAAGARRRTSSTRRREVDRADRRGLLRDDPDRGEDRVDEPVEPLDLLERRPVPRGARLAPRRRRAIRGRRAAARRRAGRCRRGRPRAACAARG